MIISELLISHDVRWNFLFLLLYFEIQIIHFDSVVVFLLIDFFFFQFYREFLVFYVLLLFWELQAVKLLKLQAFLG